MFWRYVGISSGGWNPQFLNLQPTLLTQILCQIYPQRAPAETHLKTKIIDTSKWTGRGSFFQTLERILITKVSGFAQILKSTFCTYKVLRTLHSAYYLLDSLTVFYRQLYHMWPTEMVVDTLSGLGTNSPQYSLGVTSGRCLTNFMVSALCIMKTVGG